MRKKVQNLSTAFYFLAVLFFSVACGPSSPSDYFELGKELLLQKKKKEAQVVLTQSLYMHTAYPLHKISRPGKTEIRVIPASGELATIIRDTKSTTLQLIRPEKDYDKLQLLAQDRSRDWKAALGKESPVINKQFPFVILNYQFGPKLNIAYYRYVPTSRSFAIYLENFGDESSDSQGKQAKPLFSHPSLSVKNDLLLDEDKENVAVYFYHAGSLFRNDEKKPYLPAAHFPAPFPKIGGFLQAMPSHQWQEWALLLGGGGAYRLYIMNIRENAKQILNGISSMKVFLTHNLEKVIYTKGGSGLQNPYLYHFDTKKGYRLRPVKEILEKNMDQKEFAFIKKYCKWEDGAIRSFLNDKNLLIGCEPFFVKLPVDLLVGEKTTEKATIIPVVADVILPDAKRNRFYAVYKSHVFLMPMELVESGSVFADSVFLELRKTYH